MGDFIVWQISNDFLSNIFISFERNTRIWFLFQLVLFLARLNWELKTNEVNKQPTYMIWVFVTILISDWKKISSNIFVSTNLQHKDTIKNTNPITNSVSIQWTFVILNSVYGCGIISRVVKPYCVRGRKKK